MTASKGAAVKQMKSVTNKGLEELYPGLKRYCRFLAQNSWDGDDLAQEVASKAFDFYKVGEISAALLNKIAYHQWIDTLRKRKYEMVGIDGEISLHDEKSRQDTILDTVKILIERLTPKQSVIFVLKEGFCYQAKEIAEILGTNETAVKSSLHRAKKRLEKSHTFHTVDSFWQEDEQRLLCDLMYQSLQEGDPEIFLEWISTVRSEAGTLKLANSKPSYSPLGTMCSAA